MAQESVYFHVGNVGNTHAVKEIKNALGTLPGVQSVSVNARTGDVAVDFDSTGTTAPRIQRALEGLGCAVGSLSLDHLTD